ncbi:hypothetical protein [Nocardia sp. SSK8]|uniref:hypothetical protein n=1 Tax=Nocardia sp. SSK8 TaxID=3120154 RepID=UPI00300A9AA0
MRRRGGVGFDALVLEFGTAVFFVVLTVLAFLAPETALHDYTPALSSAVLALLAGGSLAAGTPFTLGIAKQTTPQEVWTQPLFRRTTSVLAAVWTVSFTVGSVVLAALAHAQPVARVGAQVLVFVVPMVFTVRYVAHVRGRAAVPRGKVVLCGTDGPRTGDSTAR